MSDHLGPVELLAVEFPGGTLDPAGFERLVAQVDAGSVFVLDIEVVVHPDGEPARTVPVESVDTAGVLSGLELAGACTGLLDADDVEAVGARLAPGSVAVVVVYEDRTMDAVLTAWEAAGARVLLEGTVDDVALDRALA